MKAKVVSVLGVLLLTSFSALATDFYDCVATSVGSVAGGIAKYVAPNVSSSDLEILCKDASDIFVDKIINSDILLDLTKTQLLERKNLVVKACIEGYTSPDIPPIMTSAQSRMIFKKLLDKCAENYPR